MLRKSLKTKTLFVCIFRLKKLTMGCHMQRKENMIYFSNFSSSIGMGQVGFRVFWFCLGQVGKVRLGFRIFDFAWVGLGWVTLRSSWVLTWPIPILKYWHWVWLVHLYTKYSNEVELDTKKQIQKIPDDKAP